MVCPDMVGSPTPSSYVLSAGLVDRMPQTCTLSVVAVVIDIVVVSAVFAVLAVTDARLGTLEIFHICLVQVARECRLAVQDSQCPHRVYGSFVYSRGGSAPTSSWPSVAVSSSWRSSKCVLRCGYEGHLGMDIV